ncbi:MAG TPA: ATP12 family protein [Devosiaceae bacterium]|nr:ATP12 family protein [Devosiaceae bacterium]
MREFIEDAHKHRDDGYGRAQAHARGEDLPKRFYKETGVGVVDGGYTVTLDGRPTRTPGRVPVVVPVEALARLMAEEWAAQGERIDPATMPIVRLVNSAIESGIERLPAFREEVAKYAGNDLLLYRAEAPHELVVEEEAAWDAALVKLARHFGVAFQPTMGIIHQDQPEATLARVTEAIAEEELLAITALVSITSLTGSGLLAIGLREGLFTPDEVWTAAHVDEDYNMRLWGETEEAVGRRFKRRKEFDAAVKVLELVTRP